MAIDIPKAGAKETTQYPDIWKQKTLEEVKASVTKLRAEHPELWRNK